jgi:hypothetical protein
MRIAVVAAILLAALPALEGPAARSILRHKRPVSASGPLRVCADPNNLPFSNERREGFENRLAEMIAADARTTVSYTWSAQRRGFVRNTLNAGDCDVIMGVPSALDRVETTRPYYR